MSVGADAEKSPSRMSPSPTLLLLVGAFAGLPSFMVAIPAASMKTGASGFAVHEDQLNLVATCGRELRGGDEGREPDSRTLVVVRGDVDARPLSAAWRCARFPGGRACSAIGGALPLLRTIGPVGGPGRAP
ncbi:MAG TPA: hypothetical protein VFS34_17520 [Thermoanaerobaculia bacterium]|nr:hypothetical protein [Thermoanaerobaculia bacterium]